MIYELRQYPIRPQKRKDWVKLMEEKIIPFQISKGMVVIGSFVGEEDEGLYVWIRRFKNEKERERLYKAVYESDYWKNDLLPQVKDLFVKGKKPVVTRLLPTPKSVLQ